MIISLSSKHGFGSFKLAMFLVMALLGTMPSKLRALDSAVGRADKFLGSDNCAKFVLGYVHFGASYTNIEYAGKQSVTTSNGTAIPGHFALDYKYSWDNNGYTYLAFLCDEDGDVYQVNTGKSSGYPYLSANLTIQVLGNLLLEANKKSMTANDLKEYRSAISNSDARQLMTLGLKLRQKFGF